MTALTLHAPAKLNLGLAVTGRRPDGFHDLVTIFQAIGIFDTLQLTVPDDVSEPSVTRFGCSDPDLSGRDNLVIKTVEAVRAATGCVLPIDIHLRKTIPVAAGLGGASSDAGATLLGLNTVWNLGLSPHELMTLAAGLGSDVPFFLRGGCALGEGRGEVLRPMPAPDAWYVVVFPTDGLPFGQKTAAMFGALDWSDLSAGVQVFAQASRLDAGMPLDPDLLSNAFERPLYRLAPELRAVTVALREAGGSHVALTGAGPSHYTVVATEHDAHRLARGFDAVYTGDAKVFTCRSCPARSSVG